MSATAALQDLDFEVILEDGVPVEKTIHLLAMMLFRHLAQNRLRELGPDFHIGANQFVYYSVEQARGNLSEAVELFFETADPSEIERRLHQEVYVTRLEVAVG